LECFASELPADPSRWTVEGLDAAFDAILDRIREMRPHFAASEEKAEDASRIEGIGGALRHWIEINLWDFPRRLLYGMHPGVAACYLALAAAKIQQGDAQTSAAALARVLRYDPTNSTALELLAKLEKLPGGEIARRLRRQFHIRHLKSFGKSKLFLPFNVAVHKKSGSVLVSDLRQPQIAVFSLAGRLKRTLDLGLSDAAALIAEGEDDFIVCDPGHRQLVRFDINGCILETIAVRPRDPHLGEIMPAYARRLGRDRFALIVSNSDHSQAWLGEMSQEGFTPYGDLPELIHCINIIDGQLVFRGYYTGRLYRLDGSGAPPKVLELATPRLYRNYCFAPSRQGMFMDFRANTLTKFNVNGELQYILSADKMFGPKTIIMDMEAFEHDGRELLCIADHGNRCVHLFEIDAHIHTE